MVRTSSPDVPSFRAMRSRASPGIAAIVASVASIARSSARSCPICLRHCAHPLHTRRCSHNPHACPARSGSSACLLTSTACCSHRIPSTSNMSRMNAVMRHHPRPPLRHAVCVQDTLAAPPGHDASASTYWSRKFPTPCILRRWEHPSALVATPASPARAAVDPNTPAGVQASRCVQFLPPKSIPAPPAPSDRHLRTPPRTCRTHTRVHGRPSDA